MTFLERLLDAQQTTNSLLCVGLDPDVERFPDPLKALSEDDAVREFCTSIVEATSPYASAFKPNLAFFEALGVDGWHVLSDVIAEIPKDRIVVLDAKRGDIGNTATKYAEAIYSRLGGHAVTVAPYMGADSIVPFLNDETRCAFVLVATSNPSGEALQRMTFEDKPLYQHIAQMAAEAGNGRQGTVGFVVGATRPEILSELRRAYPDTPFLVPGIGAQGGDIHQVLEANAGGPVLINSSRSLLYASSGDNFAEAAASQAKRLAGILPHAG
ncbi:MAG: orotidine-5'-phosphate decarboxylase [Rubricoccaceae bacterium]|nr:orotidine-5'-phosphate decarboxylase [Rubricoccaceae bacterium]